MLTALAEGAELVTGAEALKSAIRGAERATPGGDPWALLAAACDRSGLRLISNRQPWAEMGSLLARGSLVARGPQGWLLIQGAGGDLVTVYSAQEDSEREMNQAELLEDLGAEAPDSPLPWGVVQSQAPAGPISPTEKVSPGRRVLRLFKPDQRDVKTLFVFSLVVGVMNLATPIAVEALVNTVAFVGLLQPIVVLALVLAACLGFAGVIRALEALVVELIQRRVFVRVATDLAYRLPRVRRDALDRVHGPELVNRFFDVTTVQKVGSKLLLDGITAILSAAIGLLVLAFYHPLLLAFDVILLTSLVIIVFVLGRGSVKTAIKESSAKYAVADWLEELVRHPLAFHLAGGQELALDHADTLSNSYLERRRTHYKIVFRQLVSALALQVVTSTLLLGLGGWLVKIGQLTLGQLVASWLIVSLVLSAVAKLGRQLEGVYDLLAAADKLGVLLDLPLEIESGEEPPRGPGPAALRLGGLRQSWASGGVTFQNVDLEVEPGQSVAVYGPSGTGKSTLLELIQGQRPCTGGQIDFDGVELRSLRLASLRPLIGLARSGEVITSSVVENVRLGLNLSLEEVRAALEAVGLWDEIQQLPNGLDEQLASYGRPLSEGQADLLVLARVLASKPRLLLIDGLLDGLDEEALERVTRILKDSPDWTLIVATRRLDVARRFARRVRLCRAGLEEMSS
jgi:ABC-type bacteriocin/lantibiotic exporter with double-glycine peptidase domain